MTYFKETGSLIYVASLIVLGVGLIISAVIAVNLDVYWWNTATKVAIDNKVFHDSQPYTDGIIFAPKSPETN